MMRFMPKVLGDRLEPFMREAGLSWFIFKRSPTAVAGLVIVAVFIFIAVFGPYIAPYDPYEVDMSSRLQPPSLEHPLGTDEYGRDILSRMLHGAKYSIEAGIVVLALAVPLGSLLGAVAGYMGGVVDEALMRLTDIFLAFPGLILAMAVCAALGPGLWNAMLALTLVWWPFYARLVRGQALAIREEAYIEAAKSIGASTLWIVVRHVLANSISPILVSATLDMGGVIITAAALSFLGFGAQPPTPEWGRMVCDGRLYIFSAPWYSLFPGFAILLVALGFNLLGDGLRDMLDPKLRRVIEVKGVE